MRHLLNDEVNSNGPGSGLPFSSSCGVGMVLLEIV